MARLCVIVFSKSQIIARFICGTYEDVKPIILSNRAQCGQASFVEFVRRARDHGDSHRDLLCKHNRTGQAMFVWPSDANAHPVEGGEEAYSHSCSGEPRQGTVAGDQIFAVRQATDYCGRSEEHSVDTRYGRDVGQSRFRQQQQQRAPERPSVVGAQRDFAIKVARPGRANNTAPNVDVCYACFR